MDEEIKVSFDVYKDTEGELKEYSNKYARSIDVENIINSRLQKDSNYKVTVIISSK